MKKDKFPSFDGTNQNFAEMKDTLQLHHIQQFPIGKNGLKVIHENTEYWIAKICHSGVLYLVNSYNGRGYNIQKVSDIKPLCRSFDKLTKNIKQDGKIFIPLIELSKTAFSQESWELNGFSVKNNSKIFEYKDRDFSCWNGFVSFPVPHQNALFTKLKEWFFALDMPEGSWIEIQD